MNIKDLKKIVKDILVENRNAEIENLQKKIKDIKEKINNEYVEVGDNDESDDVLLKHKPPENWSGYDEGPDPEWHAQHEALRRLTDQWERLKTQLDQLQKIDPNRPSKGQRELTEPGYNSRSERIAIAKAKARTDNPSATTTVTENKNASLKSILKELYEQEEASTSEEEPKVEFPTWLETKIKEVHGKPGQGSIFADPGSVKDIVLKTIADNSNKISEIASTTGALKTNVSGIGYDLVLPMEEAQNLADAQVEETEKVEGPNRINVPLVRTSAPMSEFATDELTIIVRPKKDQTGAIIPNEYIILSAFPGKDLPRASEWNGKYAVIVPEQSNAQQTPEASVSSSQIQERFTSTRWQRLANIIKD